MTQDLSALYELAARQGGVVTRDQARECGASPRIQQRRLRSGDWAPLFGCLAVSASEQGDDWKMACALGLRFGPRAVITGVTAMRLAGWDAPEASLLVAARVSHVRVPGVTLLRDTAPRAVSRTPVFTRARPVDALLDVLLHDPVPLGREILDLALQRHWVTYEQLESVVDRRRRRGRKGAPAISGLLADAAQGTRSHAERRMLPLLPQIGSLNWHMNDPIRLSGRGIAEGDFVLRELKLCVEVDGRAFHSDEYAFESDRARQNALVAGGWTVLRFTWQQIVSDPEVVTGTIREVAARLVARSA